VTKRRIIVTGGFGVLGCVVAEALAADGARVARVDFAASPARALEGVLDIGDVDLTDAAAAATTIHGVNNEFGGIDALVNIAGGFVWEKIEGGDIATWQRMFAVNMLTTATITSAALPALLVSPGARIVNIGAGAAIKADTGMGAYAASKAGVHRLTESLAAELAGKDITVNAILPSIIDTPTNRADMPDSDFTTWVKPEAIADVIRFLLSDQARAITGALVPVTRGG
jgi:NAD(P)-dependent dehydrogenase (short-subunit alcohol dehydrogenase family)